MKMKWWHYGLITSLVMATVVSLFASSSPDGLERVAEDLGFIEHGEGHEVVSAPMPDYAIPGIDNEIVAASLAGFSGTAIMFLLAYGIGSILKKN
ncbi:MAG: PDGLE domain-containing protein [Candidatus Altiarchaeota archaeon]